MSIFKIAHLYVTRKCPHKCSYCGVWSIKPHDMPLVNWLYILERLDPLVDEYNVLGGEPLVYPYIWELLAYLQVSGKFFTVSSSLTTEQNLVRLADVGVQSLSVSLDSLDPVPDQGISAKAKYAKLALDAWKGVGPNFCGIVISPQNTETALAAARYASDKGWLCCVNPINVESRDTIFGSVPFVAYDSFRSELEKMAQVLVEEACKGNIRLSDPPEFYQTWGSLWKCKTRHSLAVDSDGQLYPCISLYNYSGGYGIGQLQEFIDDYLDITKNCAGCNMNSSWTSDVMPEAIW